MPSKNALPRARVPRSPTAPQRFNRAYTVSLAERGLPKEERKDSLQLLGGIVGLRRFRLNHDGGVAALIELRLVGDGPDNVARTESEGCTESG